MRRRAERLLSEVRAEGKPDLDHEVALLRRIALLAESRRPLFFGRIDESSGQSWHVGRRHVEEEGGAVLVVDWRAPVATPFYRAGASDSHGLSRRRQIMVDGSEVLAVADDLFSPGADASRTRLRGGDALLAELERARAGEMLDIVATIQAEQDAVIRSPLPGLLVVQGGPGTGKTAVALHRAAYLLYNHPELERAGVLVVGPSRAFLRYVANVLPALGEESVLQVTIPDLVPRFSVREADSPVAARVKGDVRMAEVLKRALAHSRTPLTDDVTLRARHLTARLQAASVNDLVELIASRSMPYASGRTALSHRLLSEARRSLRQSGRYEADEAWFTAEVSRSSEFTALVDRLWPRRSASEILNDLYSKKGLLEQAAGGLFDRDEVAALHRPRPESARAARWTLGDAALLDEAHALVKGAGRVYGHVVVDEAQDLTPMQLRMLTRRAPRGSMTILGDLAQQTGPFEHAGWDEVAAQLPSGGLVPRRKELTLGYRAPARVLDLASRLLPASAPGIRPTRSVREGRYGPEIHRVPEEDVKATALEAARKISLEGFSVGIVGPRGRVAELEHETRTDERVGRLERDGLTRPVTLLGADGAKGLEFDAVVVLEPAEIAGGERRGLRLLYVALTRAVQRLVIVHSAPLPAELADDDPLAAARTA